MSKTQMKRNNSNELKKNNTLLDERVRYQDSIKIEDNVFIKAELSLKVLKRFNLVCNIFNFVFRAKCAYVGFLVLKIMLSIISFHFQHMDFYSISENQIIIFIILSVLILIVSHVLYEFLFELEQAIRCKNKKIME